MSKNVVFGFLGTQLDSGVTPKRWERWRPTVSLVSQSEPRVDRIELFVCKEGDKALADQVRQDITSVSPETEVLVHDLGIADPWNFPSVYAALHDFARKYAFDDAENYFVHLSTGSHVAQICLFLLTEARYFPGRLLGTRKAPAEDDSTPAWHGLAEVIDLDLSTYDQLASRFAREQDADQDLLKSGILTRNAAFNDLIARIEKVSLRSTAPILLTGPTGAGKSQLASRIFALRARKRLVTGPFVEVNCATLSGENAMSALFGHKKGAFTGAVAERAGLLRSADGGILFLDEIGELGLNEQAMLLRALEHKTFLPLGADNETKSNFQLLAGTNKDLAAEVARGTFRADLFARINPWTFRLPGLSERREDIEPNLDYELERAGAELGIKVSMNQEARAEFLELAMHAPWPGSFRDFKASIMRMATLCEGGRIRITDVRAEWPQLAVCLPVTLEASQNLARTVMGERVNSLDAIDRAQVEVVLRVIRTSRTLAEAGRQLFAVSRQGKAKVNDSDRLKKLLARLDIGDFHDVKQLLAAA